MPFSPAVVLDFARAVLESEEVYLVTEDNGRGDPVDLTDAAFSGQAFMGDLRDGVVAFDVDPEEHPENWADIGRQALGKIGCSTIRVASGSEGAEHWWFVGPVGWDTVAIRAEAVSAGVPAGQIRWGQRDCRPPLSPHRLSHPVHLLEPIDLDTALGRLSGRPGPVVPFSHARWDETIRTGAGKPSSSAAISLAVAVVNSGADFTEYRLIVESSPFIAAKLLKLGAGADKWMTGIWSDAQARVRAHPPSSQLATNIDSLTRTLGTHPWVGKAGQTDRSVFAHLVDVAREVFSLDVSRSMRTLEERLGYGRNAISRSVRRLEEAGLLERLDAGSVGQAAIYRLHPESDRNSTNTYLCGPCKEITIGSIEGIFELPDAFRGRRGLPRSAFWTFKQLSLDEYATVADVSRSSSGVSTKTIRNHLNLLAGAGLVERSSTRGQQWRRIPTSADDLVALAVSQGSMGHLANLKAYHAREREVADAAVQRRPSVVPP